MKDHDIQEMLAAYDRSELECDGATRVFSWLLKREGIHHVVKFGRLEFQGQGIEGIAAPLDIVEPHYWIELEDGGTVDFKAEMWLPGREGVPHGVFNQDDYPNVLYMGVEAEGFLVTKTMFKLLTQGFGEQ